MIDGLASALRTFAFHAGAKEPHAGDVTLFYVSVTVETAGLCSTNSYVSHAGAREPQLSLVDFTHSTRDQRDIQALQREFGITC